jgi:hypothetical protein
MIDVIQNSEKLLEKYPGPALKGQNTTAEFPWHNSRLKKYWINLLLHQN